MFGFSSLFKLADFADFMKPSQESVKPEIIKTNKSLTGAKISIDSGNGLNNQPEKLEKVQITLQDCLACSGCVTSAESVLISQQNQVQLMQILEENKKLKLEKSSDARFIVFSVSQQPLLSLAARYDLPVESAALCLSGYFRQLGADLVLNTKVADDLALLEARQEFVNRYLEFNDKKTTDKQKVQSTLPMLSSSCPGWVCYAEKTHGHFVLPYISTTRSPQQIMGVLLKQFVAKKLNIAVANIYHIAVMPCFDKKLEALRDVFYDEITKAHDVDFVITSVEIEQMLQNENKTLQDFPSKNFDWPWSAESTGESNLDLMPEPCVWAYETSTSGGFAEHIFKYAAKAIYGIEKDELEFQQLM